MSSERHRPKDQRGCEANQLGDCREEAAKATDAAATMISLPEQQSTCVYVARLLRHTLQSGSCHFLIEAVFTRPVTTAPAFKFCRPHELAQFVLSTSSLRQLTRYFSAQRVTTTQFLVHRDEYLCHLI
jgi:hypothetical protein